MKTLQVPREQEHWCQDFSNLCIECALVLQQLVEAFIETMGRGFFQRRGRQATSSAVARGGSSHLITGDMVEALLWRQYGWCAVDAKPMKNQTVRCETDSFVHGSPFEIDHIKPVSAGGGNQLVNLQLLCEWCNRAKGNMPDLAFRYGHFCNARGCDAWAPRFQTRCSLHMDMLGICRECGDGCRRQYNYCKQCARDMGLFF